MPSHPVCPSEGAAAVTGDVSICHGKKLEHCQVPREQPSTASSYRFINPGDIVGACCGNQVCIASLSPWRRKWEVLKTRQIRRMNLLLTFTVALPCLFPTAVNLQCFTDSPSVLSWHCHLDFLTPLLALLPSCFSPTSLKQLQLKRQRSREGLWAWKQSYKEQSHICFGGALVPKIRKRDWARSICRFSDYQVLSKHKYIFFKSK